MGRPRRIPLSHEEKFRMIRQGRADGLSWREIGKLLGGWKPGRVSSFWYRANSPRQPRYRKPEWTNNDDLFLMDTWSTLSIRQQAERLHRTQTSIAARRELLMAKGFVESESRARCRPWTEEETRRLATLAPDHSMDQLVRLMKRSEYAIGSKLQELDMYSGSNLLRRHSLEKLFRVTRETIASWVSRGWLKVLDGGNGRYDHTFFHVNDIREFVASHPYAYDWRLLRGSRFEVDAVRAAREPWVNTAEAARTVGCSYSQFKHYYAASIPSAIRIPSAGNQWRFKLADILAFKEQYVPFSDHPFRGSRQVA